MKGGAVTKNPLYSTYWQDESRATSSMLAVFERTDRSLLISAQQGRPWAWTLSQRHVNLDRLKTPHVKVSGDLE